MNVEFKNDLQKNLMYMTITVEKRNFINEENIVMNWRKVESLLYEQYTPPKSHALGECHNKWQKINNDYDNLCEQTWTFNLVKKQTKTTRKTTSKSKANKK